MCEVNMDEWKMMPIGYIRSPYADTQQVPKGLGTTHVMEGTLEVSAEYEQGLQDIEGFSHLLVFWVFHKAKGYELVGNNPADDRPHGVFSTHSPRRPNPIALTVVELIRREGNTLHLRGIDMLDGTPVLDIKPYTSSVPMDQLRRGWLEEAEKRKK
jgi:tRNA (adenine37-N6)-methyltransferase